MADLWLQSRPSRGSSSPDSHFFLPNHVEGSPNCCEIRGRSRRHRIAFNSLYLFSLGLSSMKQMERIVSLHARRNPSARQFSSEPLGILPVFPRLYAQKHPGGVASMTRDRGYPDWLVLSARLLWAALQARLHWYKYICFGRVWLVAM